MKQSHYCILSLFVLLLLSCNNETVFPSIELSTYEITLSVGETAQLSAITSPGENPVTWRSSDEKVATVDENGLVSAVSEGAAEISAVSSGVSAICHLTIYNSSAESITLDAQSLSLDLGDFKQIVADTEPEEYPLSQVIWSSSDDRVVTVSSGGLAEAVGEGSAVITASAGGINAKCTITVTSDGFGIGDYIYADGSCSEEYDAGRVCVGIIFWTGDPSKDDPTLRKVYPDCRNGLAVSLKDGAAIEWMKRDSWNAWATEYPQYLGYPSYWTDANATEYMSIFSEVTSDKMTGYNNTKALEKFNTTPENSEWKISPIELLNTYRSDVPLPDGASEWYLPSIKELSLLCSGELGIPVSDIPFGIELNIRIKCLVNSKMEVVSGAEPIVDDGLYWSSCENYNGLTTERNISRMNFSRGNTGSDIPYMSNKYRFIFAF